MYRTQNLYSSQPIANYTNLFKMLALRLLFRKETYLFYPHHIITYKKHKGEVVDADDI